MEASPEDDKSTPVNEENTQENLPEVDESSSEGKRGVLKSFSKNCRLDEWHF